MTCTASIRLGPDTVSTCTYPAGHDGGLGGPHYCASSRVTWWDTSPGATPHEPGYEAGALVVDCEECAEDVRDLERELAGVRHEVSALREWVDAVLADEKQAVRERDEAKATADRYREALEHLACAEDEGGDPFGSRFCCVARRVLDGGTP